MRNPYYYSQTLAEKAAWDFLAEKGGLEKGGLEKAAFVEKKSPGFSLVVINPFAILGVCV